MPSLVQIMVCRLFGAKPSSGPMLAYCQWEPWKLISVKFESKYDSFKELHSKTSSARWRPYCFGLIVLSLWCETRQYTQNNSYNCTTSARLCIHQRHPKPSPHGRAIGYLSWDLQGNMTATYRERTVMTLWTNTISSYARFTPLRWRHNEHEGVSNHQPHGCLLDRVFKENIKALRHWPLWGEFTGDRWIPAQRVSNVENVSIWWRHGRTPEGINYDQKMTKLAFTRNLVGKFVCSSYITH